MSRAPKSPPIDAEAQRVPKPDPAVETPRPERQRPDSLDELPSSTFRIPRV
jgi:hypothetical protein